MGRNAARAALFPINLGRPTFATNSRIYTCLETSFPRPSHSQPGLGAIVPLVELHSAALTSVANRLISRVRYGSAKARGYQLARYRRRSAIDYPRRVNARNTGRRR